jgi:hypothetical protein
MPEASRAEWSDDLESGLAEAMPGLRVVDRELALADSFIADVVAIDTTGRLTLVLVCASDGVQLVLATLDALAYARQHFDLIAKHLAQPLLRADLEARVVLIAESFSAQVVGRLSPLLGGQLLMFERRALTSTNGRAAYLVSVDQPIARNTRALTSDSEEFLRELPEALRATADLVIARLQRIDRELVFMPSPDGLEWRTESDVLCTLRTPADQLEGTVSPDGSSITIQTGSQVDLFLEEALGRYVELVQEGREEPELADVTVTPHFQPGLLSSAEIEAFRQ